MSRALDTGYGLGRLAFGAAVMAAPTPMGTLMLGKGSRRPATRFALRAYGTRDVVLGLGALRGAASASGARPWVVAGILADVLDVAWQTVEWDDLPKDKRAAGVAAAVGAAAAGIAVAAAGGGDRASAV